MTHSGVEEAESVMSAVQMTRVKKEVKSTESATVEEPLITMETMDSIFTPRTEEMDRGVCAPKRKLVDPGANSLFTFEILDFFW